MESRQPRVLGAQRTLSDAVSTSQKNEETKQLIRRIVGGTSESFTLKQLEQALGYFTNHNSSYTSVEMDDFQSLVDEVLNNSIRSVLVYDNFSNCFGDVEVYSLSMGFQHNLSVEALTLSGINVTDESICILCESLVRSRVNFIDLSNTPLQDEAGQSLAALAHVNPYLRTVIVDDTLIPDDVLDEIDVACQFNQSNYEGNGNSVDGSLLNESDLSRLRKRLSQIIRSHMKRVHFCVAHLFGCCPNGELCLYSHNLSSGGADDELAGLSEKISKLFTTGGNWEDKLPPRPQEGASWRSPEDATASRATVSRQRRLELQRARASHDAKPIPSASLVPAQGPREKRLTASSAAVAAGVGVMVTAIAVSVVLWRRSKGNTT